MRCTSYFPQLVQGHDGVLYLTWRSTHHEVDADTLPDASPQLTLPGLLDDGTTIDATNDALIGRLEGDISEYGIHSPVDEESRGVLLRANPAGIKPVHGFQVIWKGNRREWWVAPGRLSWSVLRPDGSVIHPRHEYRGIHLPGGDGWITLRLGFAPERYLEGDPATPVDPDNPQYGSGYTLSPPAAPGLLRRPVQNPPQLTLTFHGTAGAPGGLQREFTWSSGAIHLPLAYVEPPGRTHAAPIIRQYTTGNIDFPDHRWTGSTPYFVIL